MGLRHMNLEEFLRAVLARIQELFEVDAASVLLYDTAAEVLTVGASVGMNEQVGHGITIPLGAGFAGRVAAARTPVILDRVDATTVVNSLLWRRGLRALLGVPLLAGGDLVGVPHVGSLTPRRFTPDDSHLLHLVADRIAQATQADISNADRAPAQPVAHQVSRPSPVWRSRPATSPAPRWRWSATGTTSSPCPATASASSSVTSPATAWPPRSSWAACAAPCSPRPPTCPSASDSRRDTVVALPRGSVLALHTDGLVERPGQPLDPYLDQLLDNLTHDNPAAVCAQVTDALLGAEPPRDDVALLVVRFTPT
ncbi:GAF domain-containing protein [Actinokineospora auranticolor]|uniref:GAF domain-containing protein n=1 Tax=Actinokineospora auranticolor TaxID=155976 RepID=A0A2S6GIA6_9PSEU|nr:GAF domain-containing protein [Actinokineospora auranticolor]